MGTYKKWRGNFKIIPIFLLGIYCSQEKTISSAAFEKEKYGNSLCGRSAPYGQINWTSHFFLSWLQYAVLNVNGFCASFYHTTSKFCSHHNYATKFLSISCEAANDVLSLEFVRMEDAVSQDPVWLFRFTLWFVSWIDAQRIPKMETGTCLNWKVISY